MLTRTVSQIERIFLDSWWVFLFLILCYLFYEQGLKRKNHDYARLHAYHAELQFKKEEAIQTQEDLMLQINSQSDPAWVELTLMKGLGLVPEDQTKVYFPDE